MLAERIDLEFDGAAVGAADFLLAEIADSPDLIYREVRCSGAQATTSHSRADYMVFLGGRWLPVEAKLSVSVTQNLEKQLSQYLRLRWFEHYGDSTTSTRIDMADGNAMWEHCLIVDREGLYLGTGADFTHGTFGRPYIARSSIGKLSSAAIRQSVLRALTEIC
jgi:hypothetical protein